MTLPDMMRGRAPPRFHTETGTGTASGSAEKEAENETRREKGDAPALGTGGGAPGVETRMSGDGPGSVARTRTETESDEAVGAGSEHAGNGSEKRSFEVEEVVAVVAVVVVAAATWLNPLKLVMELLMMGLLESLALKALMAQRRRAGIETGRVSSEEPVGLRVLNPRVRSRTGKPPIHAVSMFPGWAAGRTGP